MRYLQDRLNALGLEAGGADGSFGSSTETALVAFQRSQGLQPDGQVGSNTWRALEHPDVNALNLYLDPGYPRSAVYQPGSSDHITLFTEAARTAGVPEFWARDPGLINLLRRESQGRVGVPNYTYGRRAADPAKWLAIHNELRKGRITARSSATGLGQLLLVHVDDHYPSGRTGIGDPFEEAVGMLRYIKARHRTPSLAWRRYNSAHEGY